MFDAVNDRIIFFTENNITVFSHNLNYKIAVHQISKFISVFKFYKNNAFQFMLIDTADPCTT